MESLIKLAIVAAVILLAWRALRPRPALRIVVRQGRVTRLEGIPQAKAGEIATFLERDVGEEADYVVLGSRSRGLLRITVRGRLSPGKQQRIRNFLKLRL